MSRIAAQNSDQTSFAVREFVVKGHIEKPKSTVLFSLLPASTPQNTSPKWVRLVLHYRLN